MSNRDRMLDTTGNVRTSIIQGFVDASQLSRWPRAESCSAKIRRRELPLVGQCCFEVSSTWSSFAPRLSQP